MALIEKINPSNLYHMATRMNRGNNFGYNGWRAIGEYLESLSDDLGEDLEVDIVAICCEYAMAESADDAFMQFSHEHGIDLPTMEEWQELDEEEKLETIEEFLQNESSVIICEDDLIIWQAF